MPTPEELEERRKYVEDLRAKIAEERSNNEAALHEKATDIEAQRLEAEAAALEAELASVLAQGDKDRLNAANARNIDTLATQQTSAEARMDNLKDTIEADKKRDETIGEQDPELIGVAPDEIERRKAEQAEADKLLEKQRKKAEAAKDKDNGNGGSN